MSHKPFPGRQAVFVCCDGLGAPWLDAARTPALQDLAGQSLMCADHRAVFPSVTRVSAASVATGCHPARHGLHGNRMALAEDDGFCVATSASPISATTCAAPPAAPCAHRRWPNARRRLAASAFSNVSPGRPTSSTRSISATSIIAPAPLRRAARHQRPRCAVDQPRSRRGPGDDGALLRRGPAATRSGGGRAVACQSRPHLARSAIGLAAAFRGAARRRCVRRRGRRDHRRAAARRTRVLLAVGSDHGQETIGGCIDLDDWLGRHGLAADVAAGRSPWPGRGRRRCSTRRPPRSRAWKACSTACAPSHGSANWPWRTISRG